MKYLFIVLTLFIGINFSTAQDEPVQPSPEKQKLEGKVKAQDQKIVLRTKSATIVDSPTFLCHGILLSSNDMDQLDPKTIEKIEVFKKEDEIKEKFKMEAPNGLIVITLKKKYINKFKKKHSK